MRPAERLLWDWLPRWTLAALLLYSSYAHLKNPYFFLGSVHAYGLAGEQAGTLAAAVLPFLQLVAGVCLLTDVFPVAAALVAWLLFSLFVGVQTYALTHKLQIGCGCFGVDSTVMVGTSSLLVALAGWHLALLCGLVAWRRGAAERGSS